MARGATSRKNRSARRANLSAGTASRSPAVESAAEDTVTAAVALTSAATGKTSLPLSDRDAAWDSGVAVKTLSEGQYGDAHFWRDPDGDPDTLSAYKLPFAEVVDGTLTAIWRGVTAAAAACQGARGGVAIPEGDMDGVKSRVAAFYAKAREQYDDESIVVPWEATSEDAAAMHEAHEFEIVGGYVFDDADDIAVTALAYAEVAVGDGSAEAFIDRQEFWLPLVSRTYQHRVQCSCKHSLFDHTGVDGPCQHEDGRGKCSCAGFVEFVDEAATRTAGNTMTRQGITINLDDVEELAEVEMPPEHMPRDERPERHPTVALPEVEHRTDATLKRWEATFAPEAKLTDDGRAFAPGAIDWRELPLTLMAMVETSEGGHVGAEVAGRIENIWREGNLIRATGVFDGGEYGQEIARLVGEGTLRGVSVDLAIREFEVGSRSDWFTDDGEWSPRAVEEDENEEGEDLVDLLFGGEDMIFVITDAVIGMVTVCPFPAFADATIALTAAAKWTLTLQGAFTVVEEPIALVASGSGGEMTGVEAPVDGTEVELGETLTAAAAGMVPVAPPVEWFDPPNLAELTPLVVTADGRVYGHAAAWDTCHIGIPDVCTTAPRSNTNYAYFHLGEIECENGERVACGKITLGTGHADKHLGFREAMAHYDDTGTVVADVISGEDEFGVWVAGALRPDVDSIRVRELRAAVLSGDWRGVNGNLEMVAVLAVNVPGFPVPRQRALVASVGEGENEHVEVLALVAAGHVVSAELFTEDERERIAELVATARGETLGDEFAKAFAALASRAVEAFDEAVAPVEDEFQLLAERALGND